MAWVLSLAIVLLLLFSAFWSHAPLSLKALLAAIVALALFRPADALLVLACVAPLGHALVTSVFHAYPFALSEAAVLAFFAGYLLWQVRRPAGDLTPDDDLALPSALFALVVVVSCVVQFVLVQVWHDYPLAYAASFLRFLGLEYLTAVPDPRTWVDGRGFVSTAALLLEGVAILRVTRTLCAREPALGLRLTGTLVAAGTGAALLTFYDPLTAALSTHRPLATVFASTRWSSPAVPSIDAAGTYFMFVAFLALAVAVASYRTLVPGLAATAVSIAAAWLTQTRAAAVAGIATVVAGVAWGAGMRWRGWSPTRFALGAVVAGAAVGAYLIVYNPMHVLAAGGELALRVRVLLAQVAVRMMASAPMLGVGVGQYEARYLDFASPDALRYQPGINNAHNYFLWMAAELGVIGFCLFLWLGVAALRRCAQALRADKPNYGLMWLLAGVGAFVTTWLVGQPMSVPQVAYTFWIALGIAAGQAVVAPTALDPQRRWPRWAYVALVVFVVGLVASIPTRAQTALTQVDYSRVTYGFFNAGETDDHRPYVWAGPHARMFMRSSVRAIDLPLSILSKADYSRLDVQVLVNGRPADRLTFAARDWHVVKLNTPIAPGSPERYWQIDLYVTPGAGSAPSMRDEDLRVAVGDILKDRR